jgi:hypothetical protein
MNEKERQRQLALQAAITKFDQDTKTQQLGLQRDELNLQRVGMEANIAHNKAAEALALQEVANRKDEFAADLQYRKDALKQAADLDDLRRKEQRSQFFAQLRSNEKIADINWKRDNFNRLEADLRSHADDVRQKLRMLGADGEFSLTYLRDPTGVKAQKQKEALQNNDPVLKAKAEEMLRKISEWETLKKTDYDLEQERLGHEAYRKSLLPEVGNLGPSPGRNDPKSWYNLAPSEQQAAPAWIAEQINAYRTAKNRIPEDMLQALVVEHDYPVEVVAEARRQAGILANTPEQAAMAQPGQTMAERAAAASSTAAPTSFRPGGFQVPQNAPIKNMLPKVEPIYRQPGAVATPMGQFPSLPGPLPPSSANPFLSPTVPGGTLPRAGKDSVMANKMPKHRL